MNMSNSIPIRTRLDQFIDFQNASGFSTDTTRCMLQMFVKYCEEQFPDQTSVTKSMLDSWLLYYNYSNNYQHAFIAAFRAFTRYLSFLGDKAFIPDEEYDVKIIRYIPYNFSTEELKILFDTIDSYKPWRNNKSLHPDRILPPLFRMMYCCGMRPQEPLKLHRKDVNLATGDIYIRKTKHQKDRHIIMSNDLRLLCIQYDELAGEELEYFFEINGEPVDREWMDNQFRRLWKKTGINTHGTPRPYDLRHAFATRNLMRWIDQKLDVMVLLPYLSSYMGHESIESTLYYVHLLPDRIRESAGIDWDMLNSVYNNEDIHHGE